MKNVIINEIIPRVKKIGENVGKHRQKIKFETIELLNKLCTDVKPVQSQNNDEKYKFDFVCKVLAAKQPNNIGRDEFSYLIQNDFLTFANSEASLAEEAKAILMMQEIEKKLQLIVSFPNIYSKTIIAIGGGFSSGKSQFVSSMFDKPDIKLPIGIEPVTAIPTYIVSNKNNVITGFSENGGSVAISPDFYEKLSHNYVKSFKFNLKHIMPFVTVGTPIKEWQHICFIDTPGYNSSSTEGFTDEDKKTALDYSAQSNAMIWMIGLDVNGTIPMSDIDLLSELNLNDKRLYIVANKADLRSDNELEDILVEIGETLDNYDIEYEGISAYSATMKHESYYVNMTLFDFLQKENNPIKIQEEIILNIDTIFEMYLNAIEQDKQRLKHFTSCLNSIELDLLEVGHNSTNNMWNKRINEMKEALSVEQLNEQMKKAQSISKKIKKTIYSIFEHIDQVLKEG